jgi:hypothetical protein
MMYDFFIHMKVQRAHLTYIALFIIAACAAFFTYWQTTRVVPLLDYSYQTEVAYRISLGQVPYKDFILPVTPGAYTILAILMRLFSTHSIVQVLYTAALSYFTVIMTFLVLSQIVKIKKLNLIALLPLIMSTYAIYPYVSYDAHAVLFSLISLLFVFKAIRRRSSFFSYITGITIAVPVLCKQNIGGAFLLSLLVLLMVLSIFRKNEYPIRLWVYTVVGAVTVIFVFFGFLLVNGALNDFLYQTVIFASKTKHLSDALPRIIFESTDHKTVSMAIPLVLMAAVGYFFRNHRIVQTMLLSVCAMVLFVVPLVIHPSQGDFLSLAFMDSQYYDIFFRFWFVFVEAVLCIFLWDLVHIRSRGLSFVSLLPIIVVAICIGAWLSLSVEGSTYGLYAVLPILIILLIRKLHILDDRVKWEYPLAIFSIGLACVLFVYNVRGERFKYYIAWSGDFVGSSQSHLRGLKTRGPWLAELDELLFFIDTKIPRNQSFFSCPGEDPLYSATNRVPPLRYVMLYGGTNYDDLTVVAAAVKRHNIPWIFIKQHQQLTDYFTCDMFVKDLGSHYEVYAQLKGYTVYRAISSGHELP